MNTCGGSVATVMSMEATSTCSALSVTRNSMVWVPATRLEAVNSMYPELSGTPSNSGSSWSELVQTEARVSRGSLSSTEPANWTEAVCHTDPGPGAMIDACGGRSKATTCWLLHAPEHEAQKGHEGSGTAASHLVSSAGQLDPRHAAYGPKSMGRQGNYLPGHPSDHVFCVEVSPQRPT